MRLEAPNDPSTLERRKPFGLGLWGGGSFGCGHRRSSDLGRPAPHCLQAPHNKARLGGGEGAQLAGLPWQREFRLIALMVDRNKLTLNGVPVWDISSFLVLILSHRPLILGPDILQAESLFSAKSLGRVTCHQLIINTPEDCGASARRPVSQALGHHRASCSTDKELPSLWIKIWAQGFLLWEGEIQEGVREARAGPEALLSSCGR